MIKTISKIERATRLSASGNPHFVVTFTDGTSYATKKDADVNYGIENSEFQGVPLEVTFDGSVIVGVEVA